MPNTGNNQDELVVKASWDGAAFDKGVKKSKKNLNNFEKEVTSLTSKKGENKKQSIDLDTEHASKQLDEYGKKVDGVRVKFSALQVAAVSAINNITNTVVDSAKKIVASMSSINSMKTGYEAYEASLTTMRTVTTMESMKEEGLSKESVEAWNKFSEWYADETSTNLELLKAQTPTFEARGYNYDEIMQALVGYTDAIYYLGGTGTEISELIDNLTNAIGTGAMSSQSWGQIKASQFGQLFYNAFVEKALELGTLKETSTGQIKTASKNKVYDDYGNQYSVEGGKVVSYSNAELATGWMTTDVMVQALKDMGEYPVLLKSFMDDVDSVFSEEISRDEFNSKWGTTESSKAYLDSFFESVTEGFSTTSDAMEVFSKLLNDSITLTWEYGETAMEAGFEAKTFEDAVGSVGAALKSRWQKTFEYVFGNYEEAPKLWTAISNSLYDIFVTGDERNDMLETWHEKGYDRFVEGLTYLLEGLATRINNVRDFFRNMFGGGMDSDRLTSITDAFASWAESFAKVGELKGKVQNIFSSLKNDLEDVNLQVVDLEGNVSEITVPLSQAKTLFTNIKTKLTSIVTLNGKTSKAIQYTNEKTGESYNVIGIAQKSIVDSNEEVVEANAVAALASEESAEVQKDASKTLAGDVANNIGEFADSVKTTVGNMYTGLSTKISTLFGTDGDGLTNTISKNISTAFTTLKNGYGSFAEYLQKTTTYENINKKIIEINNLMAAGDWRAVVRYAAGAAVSIKLIAEAIRSFIAFKRVDKILFNIGDSFEALSSLLWKKYSKESAKTVLIFSAALFILCGAILMLSMVKWDSLNESLIAFAAALGSVVAVLFILKGIGGSFMKGGNIISFEGITNSIQVLKDGIMAGNSIKLSLIEGFGDLVTGLQQPVNEMIKMFRAKYIYKNMAQCILMFSLSVIVLVAALWGVVELVKRYDMDEEIIPALKILGAVVGACILLLVAVALASKTGYMSSIHGGIFLLELAALAAIIYAIYKFSNSLPPFELENWKSLLWKIFITAMMLISLLVYVSLMSVVINKLMIVDKGMKIQSLRFAVGLAAVMAAMYFTLRIVKELATLTTNDEINGFLNGLGLILLLMGLVIVFVGGLAVLSSKLLAVSSKMEITKAGAVIQKQSIALFRFALLFAVFVGTIALAIFAIMRLAEYAKDSQQTAALEKAMEWLGLIFLVVYVGMLSLLAVAGTALKLVDKEKTTILRFTLLLLLFAGFIAGAIGAIIWLRNLTDTPEKKEAFIRGLVIFSGILAAILVTIASLAAIAHGGLVIMDHAKSVLLQFTVLLSSVMVMVAAIAAAIWLLGAKMSWETFKTGGEMIGIILGAVVVFLALLSTIALIPTKIGQNNAQSVLRMAAYIGVMALGILALVGALYIITILDEGDGQALKRALHILGIILLTMLGVIAILATIAMIPSKEISLSKHVMPLLVTMAALLLLTAAVVGVCWLYVQYESIIQKGLTNVALVFAEISAVFILIAITISKIAELKSIWAKALFALGMLFIFTGLTVALMYVASKFQNVDVMPIIYTLGTLVFSFIALAVTMSKNTIDIKNIGGFLLVLAVLVVIVGAVWLLADASSKVNEDGLSKVMGLFALMSGVLIAFLVLAQFMKYDKELWLSLAVAVVAMVLIVGSIWLLVQATKSLGDPKSLMELFVTVASGLAILMVALMGLGAAIAIPYVGVGIVAGIALIASVLVSFSAACMAAASLIKTIQNSFLQFAAIIEYISNFTESDGDQIVKGFKNLTDALWDILPDCIGLLLAFGTALRLATGAGFTGFSLKAGLGSTLFSTVSGISSTDIGASNAELAERLTSQGKEMEEQKGMLAQLADQLAGVSEKQIAMDDQITKLELEQAAQAAKVEKFGSFWSDLITAMALGGTGSQSGMLNPFDTLTLLKQQQMMDDNLYSIIDSYTVSQSQGALIGNGTDIKASGGNVVINQTNNFDGYTSDDVKAFAKDAADAAVEAAEATKVVQYTKRITKGYTH